MRKVRICLEGKRGKNPYCMRKMQIALLEYPKKKQNEKDGGKKMKFEDLGLIMQTIESMKSSVMELEKSMEKNNAEKISKIKEEILNLQKQVSNML